MAGFERQVVWQRFYALVDSIPRGRVATYGQIAREAGLPRHSRQVGKALRELPARTELPWHRVVGAGGKLSERAGGGVTRQRNRLRREGVVVGATGRIDLKRFGWVPDW